MNIVEGLVKSRVWPFSSDEGPVFKIMTHLSYIKIKKIFFDILYYDESSDKTNYEMKSKNKKTINIHTMKVLLCFCDLLV